jgi:hypothetical protein
MSEAPENPFAYGPLSAPRDGSTPYLSAACQQYEYVTPPHLEAIVPCCFGSWVSAATHAGPYG